MASELRVDARSLSSEPVAGDDDTCSSSTRGAVRLVTEPRLSLDDISKRWKRSKLQVLDGVNLTLPPSSMVWLGGHNGAGKTTLLRIAAGVITPDSGQVRTRGLCPERHRREYQRHVSFLPAGNSGLYARLTVRQHLRYQSRLDLLPTGVGERAIEREYQRLRLAAIDKRRVDRLSMGQRQRLRLAMAVLRNPSVLLLDEPDSSLDDEGISMLIGVVTDVVCCGGVVIWSSPTGRAPELEFDQRLVVENGGLFSAREQ